MKAKNKTIKLALIVTTILVLFIPMLYSTIYLGAFWDPYDKLENVPIAVVNKDREVVKDGKKYDIGSELIDSLEQNKKMDWKFVDERKASKGLRDSRYYATITIPENFSKTISEVDEGKTYDTKIIYSANKGKNFIFSQLSQKAAENIKFEISSTIQQEISKSLVENMYKVKDSIGKAEEGTEKLVEGSIRLSKGSAKLKTGTQTAKDGSVRLQDGLKSASEGSKKLDKGIVELKNGGDKLTTGAKAARDGSDKLVTGLSELSRGEEKIVNGTGELVAGLETLKKGISTPNEDIVKLVEGAKTVSEYNTKLAKGTDDLNTQLNLGLNAVADGLKVTQNSIEGITNGLEEELKNIDASDMDLKSKEKLKTMIVSLSRVNEEMKKTNVEETLREASKAAVPLRDGMNKLDLESSRVSEGVSILAKGLEETQEDAKTGVESLLSGAREIQKGSGSLLDGLNKASTSGGELTDGIGTLYDGTVSLGKGLSSAGVGSHSLEEGLYTAYLKTGELSLGLESLNKGANDLTNGLNTLDNGQIELRDGLKDGYEELEQKLKFNATDMSNFMANPVSIEDKSINEVGHYGEGLAPYFVSLSLWLGAMFINLILSVLKKVDKKNRVEKSKLNNFVRDFLFGSVLVIIQALILSISLVTILKLSAISLSGFFLCNMFISLVFFSLMYAVSYAIGIIGTPIMFVFFLIQISSAGGTFPVETAPYFYRTISHIIPMTYSVNILRMVISGINSRLMNHNLLILTSFMTFSMLVGFNIRSIIEKLKRDA